MLLSHQTDRSRSGEFPCLSGSFISLALKTQVLRHQKDDGAKSNRQSLDRSAPTLRCYDLLFIEVHGTGAIQQSKSKKAESSFICLNMGVDRRTSKPYFFQP